MMCFGCERPAATLSRQHHLHQTSVVMKQLTNGYTTHSSFCVQQRPWTPTKRRGPISAEFLTPGPADISLPTTFGPKQKDATRSKSPAFTFAGKHEEKNKFFTPGPGSYDVSSGISRRGKETAIGPSFLGRPREPEPFRTPAPGDYTPEKCEKTVLNASPSYSFGLKAKDLKPDNVPAPGAYSPEKMQNTMQQTSPSYSFGFKPKDQKPDMIPAPGHYDPEKSEKAFNNAPSYTFGAKHRDLKPDDIPAPGHYDPEKSEKAFNNAPSYTFGAKHRDLKPDNVPAPNSYNIPDAIGTRDSVHFQSPSFSMGGKDSHLWTTNKNPGPGSYNVPGSEVYKQKSPSYTLSPKTNMPGDKSKKPGPGAHSPEKVVMRHSPSYSFGIRHSQFAHGFNKEANSIETQKTVS